MNTVLHFDGLVDPRTGDKAAIDIASEKATAPRAISTTWPIPTITPGGCIEVQVEVDNGPGTLSMGSAGIEFYNNDGNDDAIFNFRGQLSDV